MALAGGLCDLEGAGGGVTLAEGVHGCGRRAAAPLNYTMAFAFQLKSTESLNHCSRVDEDSLRRTCRLFETASAGLVTISPPRLNVGDFSRPSVGASSFQFAEIRGSPHQLTLRSFRCRRIS